MEEVANSRPRASFNVPSPMAFSTSSPSATTGGGQNGSPVCIYFISFIFPLTASAALFYFYMYQCLVVSHQHASLLSLSFFAPIRRVAREACSGCRTRVANLPIFGLGLAGGFHPFEIFSPLPYRTISTSLLIANHHQCTAHHHGDNGS